MTSMDLQGIRGGILIDGTGAPPLSDPIVLTRGSRIVDVFSAGSKPIPPGAAMQILPGATIMPGLIDAHVHVAGLLSNAQFTVDGPESLTDMFMRRLTRHGITTVRDTGSPDTGETFPVFKRGRPEWPRFFGSGPNLDGLPGGPWKGLRALGDAATVRTTVRELAERGVDFVKLYAWMEADLVRVAVDESHSLGLLVAAHVGNVLTVEEAASLGVDAFEHVRLGRELLTPTQRQELADLPPRQSDDLGSFAAWRYADPQSALTRKVIRQLVDRGTFLTPTLTLSESILQPRAAGSDPGDWNPPASVLEAWEASRYSADYSRDDWRWAPVEFSRQQEFIGLAHGEGLRIVAGTDTPNPFIGPGESLHRELRLLAACGLPTVEVIRSATGRAAELLGRSNDLGAVEPGRLADIVAVSGDPIEDLSANTILLVMRDGNVVFDAGSQEAP
jgi:imidazolonepropionase-like amidohydrolase